MKWRYYAEREFPRVVRELGIPCATRARVTGMSRCPRHGEPLGEYTRTCPLCLRQAWGEVSRRYAAQGRPFNQEPERKESIVSTIEYVEGDVVPDEPGTELVLRPQALFGTDPEQALRRQVELSKLVVGPVEQQHLFVNIRGRKYVKVEGWELVGAMKSVFASIVWTRPNESGDGYIARAEARWLDGNVPDGRLVGAGEAECSRAEPTWKDRPAYSLRSMAQTRAISRALRGPLGPVFVLADYEMVGAEEMIAVEVNSKPEQSSSGPIPDSVRPTPEQVARIRALIDELAGIEPDVDWKKRAGEIAGVPGNMLTGTIAAIVIGKLGDELVARGEPEVAA